MTNACANDVATALSLFDIIKRHVISISREIYAKILRLNDHIIYKLKTFHSRKKLKQFVN